MNQNNNLKIFFVHLFLLCFSYNYLFAEDKKINAITDQLQIITKDIKTLEKAVYNSSNITSKTLSSNGLNEEILTRHLLKLNEIEEQFRLLTNRFEEINFKLDKLSNRVTKIQSDTQLRFSDLEIGDSSEVAKSNKIKEKSKKKTKQVKLPGSDKPQDLGAAPGYSLDSKETKQATQSVEATASVFTEERKPETSLLPNKPSKEQYDFALSFMKVGDYETAELALREFIDKNKTDELAGSAQYWYGETFRIRQLYSDAATAYLDGYQNYPKSKKAPENLLKLGSTMVELGEKDQGCKMISGLKKQYPKASQSVLQKAQYEQKRFKCSKT
ncbi:MAG: tol-pal system protein YbgF [Pelagibacteraceae bacterium]|mgnify:CR=1 FL=1|jgi:tol-pal system protein YbgF|nr:tol-pal system protein YbgF [Pelagibacteraceae bacterium]